MKLRLTEMAMSRGDAIAKASALSTNFRAHFEKVYDNPDSSALHHWQLEMQSWLNDVLSIRLKPDSKKLSLQQMMDWFLTGGSDAPTLFGEGKKADAYDQFIEALVKNNYDVEKAFREIV